VNSLFIGLIAGVFGVAYLMYGKRRTKVSAMVSGALLCVYPYFTDDVLWLTVIGAALLAAPFFIDY
jgi:hypothetical protein